MNPDIKLFTIPASAPFAETLASGLVARVGADPLALAGATIYLPTRRAARNFGDAFARVLGGAALLPSFRPLGDVDEDELLLDDSVDAFALPPAIAPLRRRLLLATLIRRWRGAERGENLAFTQAAALADGLSALLDEVETQGADLDKLDAVVPGNLAEHWTDVRDFLALLKTHWPDILADEGAMNPAARRNTAIDALAQRLEKSNPAHPVIAAGSTGSIPATAHLLGIIARLSHGAVVLPGLDRDLDEASWSRLDEGHPQFGMQQLLARIGAERGDVKDWIAPTPSPRTLLLRETLRPAPTTDAWRALADKPDGAMAKSTAGFALLEAADPAEEASAIALILRQALDTPKRTAALVTTDRALARRVAAELGRWDIVIDDSAGRPLAHTAAGAFLCLLADAADQHFAPVPLLALLKHPLAMQGREPGEFRALARRLDIALRGPRPDPGLSGILRSLRPSPKTSSSPDLFRRPIITVPEDGIWVAGTSPAMTTGGGSGSRKTPGISETHDAELESWFAALADALRPFEDLMSTRDATLTDLITAHVAAAQRLATDANGELGLWCGDAGEAAANLIAALREAAQDLPPVEPGAYAPLFRDSAETKAVRPPYSRHPRLSILGPLEARQQSFDLVVLGGLNEGSWPRAVPADPWLSRPMRKAIGLEAPERAIGLAAHDFATLAAAPEAILTRALKFEGTPTIASRWVQRLVQLARGLGIEASLHGADAMLGTARALNDPGPPRRMARPAPKPPVTARPRSLSVTEIETWLRDPYAIYAKRILRLRPLDPLDAEIGPLERGTAIHKALELFLLEYPGVLPPDAASRLLAIADDVFADLAVPKAALALWRPRFAQAADRFVREERVRRLSIAASPVEIRGEIVIGRGERAFRLHGRADRIDLMHEGGGLVLDYKTGATPTDKQVRELLSPQLPLEAAILAEGGFEGIGAAPSAGLVYVRFGGAAADMFHTVKLDDADALAADALSRLAARVAIFDETTTPYYPRVLPFRVDSEGDYDHLARVREWSLAGEEDGE